jgi:hypothetical protein
MGVDLRKFTSDAAAFRSSLSAKVLFANQSPSLRAKVHGIAVRIEDWRFCVHCLGRDGKIARAHQFDENRLNVSAIGAAYGEVEIGKVCHVTPTYNSYRLKHELHIASCVHSSAE